MSKFIDRLSKVGQTTPAPLGFGTKNKQETTPAIFLLGHIAAKDLKGNSALLKAPVDCFLVNFDQGAKASNEKQLSSLEGHTWGAKLKPDGSPDPEFLKTKGCDFVIFGIDETPADVFNDEALGRLITVDLGLEESVARGIDYLPIDAVLIDPGNDLVPLTVKKMVELQSTRGMIDKPCLLSVESSLGDKALEALQDAGIEGLVVSLPEFDAKSLQNMKNAIDALPKKKARKDKGDRIVPRLGLTMGLPPSESPVAPDEEDDDDDNDI